MRKSHLIALAAVLAVCLTLTAAPSAAAELRGKFVRVTEKVVGDREYVGIVLQPFDKDAQVTVLFSRTKADMLHLVRRLRPGQKLEIVFVREGEHMWLKRIEAGRLAGDRERAERRERAAREKRDGERRERVERDKPRAERVERVERARRDRDRPDRRAERPKLTSPQLRELSAMIDRLQQGLQRIQREMNELREENARLRRLLHAREGKVERHDRPKTDRDKSDKPRTHDG